MKLRTAASLLGAMSLLWPVSYVRAAELPKATEKALAAKKIDKALLAGLDKELDVPKGWLDAAAQEKEVIILGTWDAKEFSDMTAPFRERYPFLTLRYKRGGTAQRTMQVLVALGQGRVIADVITGIADATFQFREMKALADLRELPSVRSFDASMMASDGTWLSHKLSFRCMSYNTGSVKKDDLPATWDDLVSNPRWRNNRLALTNNADSWVLVLWNSKGEQWGRNFLQKLFEDVKPQRRKEGLTATTALTVAGEFHASLPSPEWVVQKYVEKGAPVGYHCPTPVPVTVSQIAMLDKAPHKSAARIFINWMLSTEGQILQFTETAAVPVRKALQSPQFVPFSDTVTGKPHLVRDDTMLGSELNKKMIETWAKYWTMQGTGK